MGLPMQDIVSVVGDDCCVCEFRCVHVEFLDANWSVCRAEAWKVVMQLALTSALALFRWKDQHPASVLWTSYSCRT